MSTLQNEFFKGLFQRSWKSKIQIQIFDLALIFLLAFWINKQYLILFLEYDILGDKPDLAGVVLCICIWFCLMSVFALNET